MLFTSPLFLSLFLPILLLLYMLADKSCRNGVLLIASLFFYSWGEPKACFVMLALILVNYITALRLQHMPHGQRRTILLSICIAFDIGTLFVFKYLDFLIKNLNLIADSYSLPELPLTQFPLPIGISFYCFQAISYTVDVYRREVDAQHNLYHLALYISLFPQLIAGPIVRYSTISQQLSDRTLCLDNIFSGLVRFSIGLAKKVFIADNMGLITDTIFVSNVHEIPQGWAWIGIIAYTLQIYYDFSAYSDMAIGLGRVFNFNFLENFTFPYSAISIREFWHRWHISLSTWFRDYLYIPLGGNRISTYRTIINQLIVFALCGIWHGASWNFLVWGLWHGFGLLFERFCKLTWPFFFGNIYVWTFVIIGWVFFRSPDLSYALDYLFIMFCGNSSQSFYDFLPAWLHCISISNALFMLLGLIFCYPIRWLSFNLLQSRPAGTLLLSVFFLATYAFAMTSSFSPFIYFRF